MRDYDNTQQRLCRSILQVKKAEDTAVHEQGATGSKDNNASTKRVVGVWGNKLHLGMEGDNSYQI